MKKWNYKALTAACLGGLMVIGATGCSPTQTTPAETVSSTTTEAVTEASAAEESADAASTSQEVSGTEEASGAEEITGEGTDGSEDSAAPGSLEETIQVWGPVLWTEDGQIAIDNQSQVSSPGELVLNIDPEGTYILDGLNGYPVELSEINKDEVIYAYIGPAMTMSLPPQTSAIAVICQIPQDSAAAQYVIVSEMEQQKDESWLLTTTDGTQYQVPADCQILPYLTRNIVRLPDVQTGSRCLIWSNDGKTLDKIVLFGE